LSDPAGLVARERFMALGKFDTMGKSCGLVWPLGLRVLVTLVVLIHAWAIVIGGWSSPPSSELEVRLAEMFHNYYDLIDQGYSYRYYAPEPPPTPVVTATIHYADGRVENIRLPDRGTRPRLLYQRELALANALFVEVDQARRQRGEVGHGPWAQSYARHLGKQHPGAQRVTLSLQFHLIPDLGRVRAQWEATGRVPDLDAPEFYTVPERIGDYPCDGL
jgi:hypothetical protein